MTELSEQNDKPLGVVRRLLGAGRRPVSPETCADLRDAAADAEPRTPGRCEDHTDADGPVVHLRLCLACGYVGCCDSSAPKHATAHFRESGHPVMRSAEPGESWRWCFAHELLG